MARPFRHPSSWLALLAAAILAGCAGKPASLEKEKAVVQGRWQELSQQAERPVKTLTWAEAVAKLEAGNPKLRQARNAILAGEEAVRQVPRNYIPELSLNLFAYPTFGMLGDGRLGDTFFFLGTLISLPSPVQYRAEALQARLQFLAAQIDAEILRRDLQVQLYRAFRKAERLTRLDTTQRALAEAAGREADSLRRQADALADQSRAGWGTLEPELSELLGDYSAHWRPQRDANFPVLDYSNPATPIDQRPNFAALQVTKAALQLVALDAQRQGLLVAEWPQASVLLSAPPLYQRSAGRESYLSFQDLRVSGFVSYSTDLRGTRALARKQAARRADQTRAELDLAMQGTITRLHDGIALLTESTERARRLESAAAALQQAGKPGEAATVREQAEALAEQIDDLNLSFWVLDDPRWQHSP